MIIEQHAGQYFHCRIPGIISTEDGSLLAYYECRKSDSDWAEIDIKIIRSDDKGEHWNTVKILSEENCTLNNPVMICNGKTLHFLCCKNYKEVFYCTSNDDGISWSEPVAITDTFNNIKHTVLALGPGHGIVTKNGVMIIPVWYAYNAENKLAHHPSFIGTVYSKDCGKTWLTGELIKKDFLINPSECAMGFLNNGQVVMSIRNESTEHLRCFAKSKNGYSDWYDVNFDSRFSDPICQGSITNRKNTIYHINCDDKNERKNLTVKMSDDDLKNIKTIKIDNCGGYSDICIIENTAYVIYEDTTDTDDNYFVDLKFKRITI